VRCTAARCHAFQSPRAESGPSSPPPSTTHRRQALAALTAAAALLRGAPAGAVQGSIAGRIPGITGPDSEGFFLYTRPEGKSGADAFAAALRSFCFFSLAPHPAPWPLCPAGGHGIGWSEIPRYSFRVPAGWDETPVSIADLGGTEIDLRYGRDNSGSLQVVVAPVLRFVDVGYNANVRIDQLFTPEVAINGFAPELFGSPLNEEDVVATRTVDKGGVVYYQWEVKPHHLVAATAVGNRMFILSTTSNSRQWRKAEAQLREVQASFFVPAV
jgi:hypothetical protein